jgi:hypothetical protein
MNACDVTTVMMATTVVIQRQHSATMATVTPPGAGPEAMLEAACALLHNPPSPHASPSTAEQCYHDIDQLIIAAINMLLHRERWVNHSSGALVPSAVHSRSPMAPHALSATRALVTPRVPVASLTTADLRAELKRRRSGEDGRITIKHHRERCRNLDGGFGVANTTPMRQAARTPTSLGSGVGCMALAPHLHMVVWPYKFWPHLPLKYDGSVNPTKFLQIHTTSILAAGGNEVVLANYFLVALTGMARSWLLNQSYESLTS